MSLYRNLAVAGLAAGIVVGGGVAASAHYRGHYYPGCNCGPVAPTTHYKTIHVSKSETRVHDINKFRHVQRIHHVTNVTRIQPIIRIHDITRIHHHTIVETRTAYRHVTQHLTPIRIVTRSVHNYYDCHCGY